MRLFLFVKCAVFFLSVFTISRAGAQTTGYSNTGGNIDVIYQRCNWRINPDSAIKAIGGSVLMRFKTIQNSVSQIKVDLSSAMTISKIVFRGSNLPAANISRSGNVVTISFGVTLANNITDEIDIFYNGTPPAFGDYGEGYEKAAITGMGNVIYTLAESYGDDDWWPCKADMQDKIEAMDIIISMPSAFRAASNGVLVSDVVSGLHRIMTYKSSNPIASYLVAVGVAKYTVYNRTPVNISGTNVPIVYYVYSGRTPTTTQLSTMDYCRDQMMAFSNKFGDYPFKNEKYGMYEFGWGGGMEHQTFSAMGWTSMINWSVIAHELAHQWFGDKVTFATWNHLWLAEGFAKYSEVLAAELVTSMGKDPVTHRSAIKTTALATSTTPIYLSAASIQNSNTLWTTTNDNALYQRGAMVVSMLRKLAGDDKFFQALKNYLADPALAYKSATTENLRDHFEAVLGYDLDAFFTDYIYGTGNPAYDINWGNVTNSKSINIELTTQRKSTSSTVTYFRTPVVLKISNATIDTTVVIYDENGKVSYGGNGIRGTQTGKMLSYNLSFIPTTVTVDPNAETLVRGQDATTAKSTVTKVTRLNVPPVYILPISIIDFNGQKTASGNLLSLHLVTTDENISVIVERSEDGAVFSSIGNMAKGAVTNLESMYSLEDQTFSNAHALYYRARTTDEKGLVKYSKVVSLKSNAERTGSISIRPNVVRDNLKIVLSEGWERGPVAVTVFNSSGVIVKKEKRNGANRIEVAVRDLTAGNYNVQVTRLDGTFINRPFIIVR